MNMDQNSLIQALNLTLNPQNNDDIRRGEEFLANYQDKQGYCSCLLNILSQSNVLFFNQLSIQQQQGILSQFKITIQENWQKDEIIYQTEKTFIKVKIQEILLQFIDQPSLSKTIQKITEYIAQYDFPNNWQGIIDELQLKMQNNCNLDQYYTNIMIIKCILKKYEWTKDEDRQILDYIVQTTFPLFIQMLQNIGSSEEINQLKLVKLILKTFLISTNYDIPNFFISMEIINQLMLVLTQIFESPCSDFNQNPTDIRWKIKKWVLKTVLSFFFKISDQKKYLKNQCNFFILEFYDYFQQNYCLPFLNICMNLLFKKYALPMKISNCILKMIDQCLLIPYLQAQFYPLLERTMYEICLQQLYLNQEDARIIFILEMWRNDPEEFLRREENFTDHTTSNRIISLKIINQICKFKDQNNESFLSKFMNFCNNYFQSENQDKLIIEALMNVLGSISQQIKQNPEVFPQIEYILINYMFNELGGQIGMVTSRACWIFGKFHFIEYQNQNFMINLAQNLYKCLQNKEVIVKVKAAEAISKLLTQPILFNEIKPNLQQILEIHLNLLNNTERESLVFSLECIVANYKEDILPYALILVQHLINAVMKYSNELDKINGLANEEEEDECFIEEFSSERCIKTIKRIIDSNLSDEIYKQIYQLIHPLILYVLSNTDHNLLEPVLECLNSLIIKPSVLMENLWIYYYYCIFCLSGLPENYYSISQQIGDFNSIFENIHKINNKEYSSKTIILDQIYTILRSFIQKGSVQELQKDFILNKSPIQLLFDLLQFQHKLNDSVNCCLTYQVFESLIEWHKNQIDQIIPYLIQEIDQYMPLRKEFLQAGLKIYLQCLFNNTQFTLNYLQGKQNQTKYLMDIFQNINGFRSFDFKVKMYLGFANIIQLPQNQIPQYILEYIQPIMKQMVKTTSDIHKHTIKQNQEDLDNPWAKFQSQCISQNINTLLDDEDDDDDSDYGEEIDDEENDQAYVSLYKTFDPILYFQEILKVQQMQNLVHYQNLISCLDAQEQSSLIEIFAKQTQENITYQ